MRGLNGKSCEYYLCAFNNKYRLFDAVLLTLKTCCSLFAFPTPNFVPPDYVRGSKLVIPPEIADHPSVRDEHTLAPGKSNQERFCRHTIDLLTCRYISQNFRTGSEKETFWFQFTRCLHALAAWSSYSLQLVFPIFSIAALVFVFTDKYCSLRLGECTFAEKRMSFQSDGDFWDP